MWSRLRCWTAAACATRAHPADYSHRLSAVKGPGNEWFIGARLEFERKPGVNSDAIKELLDKRRADPAHRRVELRIGVHQPAASITRRS